MLYTKHKALATTTETLLFSVPTGFHVIIYYVFIANHDGSTNSASLNFVHGGERIDIFDDTNISGGAKETLGNGGGPLFVLHEGEDVYIQTGSAGNVEFSVTFDLLEAPNVLVNFA